MTVATTKKKVNIYTDGSCLGNPGPGGWAALLRYQQKQKMLTGHAHETTNNRMELTAVIEALKLLKQGCEVALYTDSKYVMDGASKWMANWKKKGWMRNKKDPVKNADLWQALDQAMSRHEIQWHWVKGHSGHAENEAVDQAAREQAEQISGANIS